MACVFKLEGLQQPSGKNTAWLVICVSIYAFLLILLMQHLAAFADSMAAVASILGKQQSKYIRTRYPNMKYILLWKRKMRFINRLSECNSSTSNCFLTENKALFGDNYSYFDAIVFDQSHLTKKWVPIPRSPTQLYIFTSEESPSNYPACELHNDEFFNWTFTYRLDSDIVWKFFVVRDVNGDIVAPSINVQWNKTKHPINETIKAVLKGKTKALAWIVSNCKTMSFKDQHLMKLQEELFQYSLYIDIYGDCTKRICSENGDCDAMLRKNYYFYIAFEDSLDDDYVTREVLHGYNNYAVPIVYGGADYNRFLPPSSYIDARQIHPHNLAQFIHATMSNPAIHQSFFYWTNFYTIDSNYSTYNPTCDLCKAINSEKAKNAPAKKKFRFWWNTPNGMKWCLPEQFWREYTKNNLDSSHIYRDKY